MTQEEKIEWLAVKVMGWQRTSDSICPEDECVAWNNMYIESMCGLCKDFKDRTGKGAAEWKPLTDWNHTMEMARSAGLTIENCLSECVWDNNPRLAICKAAFLALADAL